MFNNQPEIRTHLLELLSSFIFRAAENRYAQTLDQLYTKQLRYHPDKEVGFRFKGEVYCFDKSLEITPARFARLHTDLVPEFEALERRYTEWQDKQTHITNCLTDGLLLANTIGDVVALFPEAIANHIRSKFHVREPKLSIAQIERFQSDYAEELGFLREQLVLNVLEV